MLTDRLALSSLWREPIFLQEGGDKKVGEMPLKTFDATVSNFASVFEKFKSENSQNQPKFLLFLADNDPSTNRSWCPDCVRAEPVINEKLSASTRDLTLLRAYVRDRPTWRNPGHLWRVDPRFKLTGVPTLFRWENDAVAGRLEDYEAHVGAGKRSGVQIRLVPGGYLLLKMKIKKSKRYNW